MDAAGSPILSFQKGVTAIGNDAFDACRHLESIHVAEKNTAYSDKDGVLFNKQKSVLLLFPQAKANTYSIPEGVKSLGRKAFCDCIAMRHIIIPDGVIDIGESTFFRCESLEEITVPDSVVSIGASAFYGCSGLTSLRIPAKVTQIGVEAFYNCDHLTRFVVDPNNQAYASDLYGALFNKEKTKLLQYPAGHRLTTYVIPQGVTEIASNAFSVSCDLENVVVPDSVNRIDDSAFDFGQNLKTIHFRGNAPEVSGQAVFPTYRGMLLYYPQDATGWSYPWCDCATESYPLPAVSCLYISERDNAPVTAEVLFASELLPSAYTVYFAYYDRNGKLLHVDAAPGQNTGYPLLMETYQAHSVRTMTLDAQNRPIADAGQWTEGAHYAVITGIQTGKDSGSGPQAQLLFPDGVKTVVDLTADYGSGTAAAYGKDSAAVVGDLVAYSKNSDGAYALTYAGCTQAAFDQTAAVAAYGGTFALTGSNKIPVGTNPADTDKAESLNTWSIADDAVIYVADNGSGTDMSTYRYKTITGTQMKKATNGGQGFTCLFAAASRQLDGSGTCNVKLAYVIYNPDTTAVSDTYYGYITSVYESKDNDDPPVYVYTMWNGAEYVRVTAATSVAITGVQQDGSDFKPLKSGDLIAYKVNADKVLTEIVDCYDLSAYNAFVDKSNQPQRGNSYGLIGIGQYENGVLTFKALDASQQTDHKTLPAITNRNAFGNWYEADAGTKYIYIDTSSDKMSTIGATGVLSVPTAQDYADQTDSNKGTLVPNAFFVADKDGTVQLLVLDISGDIMSR